MVLLRQSNHKREQMERQKYLEESLSDGYVSDLRMSNRRLKFKAKNYKRVKSSDV